MTEEINEIGNRYEDCILACYNCGTKKDIHQVAFRNENSYVVGYTFLCDVCHPHIANNKFGFKLIEVEKE